MCMRVRMFMTRRIREYACAVCACPNCFLHMYAQCPVSREYTRINGPMHPFVRVIVNIVPSLLQHVHVVHHLCRVSTADTRANVDVHSVYKLCTVPTCVHSVYRLYSGKCTYATFFLRGAPCAPSLIFSPHFYNMSPCGVLSAIFGNSSRGMWWWHEHVQMSTTCAHRTPPMHSVYGLHSGERGCAQCLQVVQEVYHSMRSAGSALICGLRKWLLCRSSGGGPM